MQPQQGAWSFCVICPRIFWRAPTSGSSRSNNNACAIANPTGARGFAAQTAADQAKREEAERHGLPSGPPPGRWSLLDAWATDPPKNQQVAPRWEPLARRSAGLWPQGAGLPAADSPCQREAPRARWPSLRPRLGVPPLAASPSAPSPAAGVEQLIQLDPRRLLGQGAARWPLPPTWRRAVTTDAITSAESQAGGIGPGR